MAGGFQPIETLYRGYRFRSRLEARWAVFFDVAGIPWRYEEQGYDLSGVQVPGEPSYANEYAPFLYLPDFYLPEQDCWIEVKPGEPTDREIFLMSRLVMGFHRKGYFLEGLRFPHEALRFPHEARDSLHPRPWFEGITSVVYKEEPLDMYDGRRYLLDPAFADRDPYPDVGVAEGGSMWCECPRCSLVGIALYGDAAWLACGCCSRPEDRQGEVVFLHSRGRLLRLPPLPTPRYTYESPRLMAAYKAARQARFEHGERSQAHVYQAKLNRIRKILDSDA